MYLGTVIGLIAYYVLSIWALTNINKRTRRLSRFSQGFIRVFSIICFAAVPTGLVLNLESQNISLSSAVSWSFAVIVGCVLVSLVLIITKDIRCRKISFVEWCKEEY